MGEVFHVLDRAVARLMIFEKVGGRRRLHASARRDVAGRVIADLRAGGDA